MEQWAGRGTGPVGGTPAHSPPLFISVVSMLCWPTLPQGAPATRPRQPPAPLTASSCIFDKVIGIFLLTGFSLHFTCSFPRAHSTGSGAVCLAWLPFPVARPRQDSPILIYFVF